MLSIRQWALKALVAAALLAPGVVAAEDRFERGPRYDPASVTALVDRVHTDLDHAYGVFHFSGDDRERLNHAEKELRDFAKKWYDHHFDKDELDGAIGGIQHVLDKNKLPGDSRDALSDDLSQLRAMRSAYDRHEIRD